MTKDPAPVAILAARIMRAYPSLSPYSAASLADELCAIERAQRRHAERCCSGADGGYVHRVATDVPKKGIGPTSNLGVAIKAGTIVHDPAAEQRARARVLRSHDAWKVRILDLHQPHQTIGSDGLRVPRCELPTIETRDDPRGPVLLVRLPGEAEAGAV